MSDDTTTPNNSNGNDEFKPLAKPSFHLSRFLFYFITLAVLVIIYLKYSEIEFITEVFARSNYMWLAVIIVLQAFSYYFQALNYRDVLRMKDLEVKPKELYPMSFVVQFLNQALPSAGISGQVFFVQYLKKYGLTVSEGIGRALLEVMTLWMAFGTFFVISSVLVLKKSALGAIPEIRFLIYLFIFFAIVAVGVFFALQRKKRSKMARWIIDRLHRYFENRKKKNKGKGTDHSKHVQIIFDQFGKSLSIRKTIDRRKKSFWMAYFWQNMILLSHIITLYLISLAIGHPISFILAFVVFTLVKFISMIAFVPGGLGVFEGGMTLIFISFGVPANPAFAMTMLLRAFTFWFPMPIGWILYRYYSHREELANPYKDLLNSGDTQGGEIKNEPRH